MVSVETKEEQYTVIEETARFDQWVYRCNCCGQTLQNPSRNVLHRITCDLFRQIGSGLQTCKEMVLGGKK